MSLADDCYLDAKNGINNLTKKHCNHVMCFGTFDIFHPGHVYYLSEAEKLAEQMTIVIARDTRVERLKGKMPHDTEDARLMNVANAFDQSGVILGDEEDIFVPIRQLHPDVLAFGYDQRVPEDQIRELFPNIEIVRIG